MDLLSRCAYIIAMSIVSELCVAMREWQTGKTQALKIVLKRESFASMRKRLPGLAQVMTCVHGCASSCVVGSRALAQICVHTYRYVRGY